MSRERENECWWKVAVGENERNVVRYSVTPPCSIYSRPPATCTFLSLCLKRNGKQRGRTAERLYLEERSMKRDEEVRACTRVGVAPAHDVLPTEHTA